MGNFLKKAFRDMTDSAKARTAAQERVDEAKFRQEFRIARSEAPSRCLAIAAFLYELWDLIKPPVKPVALSGLLS